MEQTKEPRKGRHVNLNPTSLREAEIAMSNAYYNFLDYNGGTHGLYEITVIWDVASKNYRRFKKR